MDQTSATQNLHAEMKEQYDFIVCCAGSSGSVVAGRLSANQDVSVLLLEAGGSDETDMVLDTDRWPRDMEDLIVGVARVPEIGNAPALRFYTKGELAPGNLTGQALEQYIRKGLNTCWHQSCTAKMGCDDMSVVDGKLKVYGIEGLRIANASILPRQRELLLKEKQSREGKRR